MAENRENRPKEEQAGWKSQAWMRGERAPKQGLHINPRESWIEARRKELQPEREAAGVLQLPEAIGKQPEWLGHASGRKLLRVGRRGSKTRFGMLASLAGHGTGWPETPALPGVLQGGDVLWVAVDYPQLLTVVWTEELRPRFKDLEWAKLNENKHELKIEGLGTLFLRSSEALKGVRGMGKNLRGVIVDEAAHFDLEHALLDIVLPTLIDNRGWLALMSTTNAGLDGNQAKRVPSFFNLLCERVRGGDPKLKDWVEFEGTAFDNPAIDPAAIQELIEFYPKDSAQADQEIWAKLLKGGAGLALPQMTAERHLVEPFVVPSHWPRFGAFDWGYWHPYAFGEFAVSEDGTIVLIDTHWGMKEEPDVINAKLQSKVNFQNLRYVVCGIDIKHELKARGEKGPTIKERFQGWGWKVMDATVSRNTGLQNLRLYVEWKGTEWTPEHAPRFVMMNTPGNRWTLECLTRMQVDPEDLEDALKVNGDGRLDAAGFPANGDDPYDMVRYGLMSRPIAAPNQPKPALTQDHAPFIDYEKGKPGTRQTAQAWLDSLLGPPRPKAGSIANNWHNMNKLPRWK